MSRASPVCRWSRGVGLAIALGQLAEIRPLRPRPSPSCLGATSKPMPGARCSCHIVRQFICRWHDKRIGFLSRRRRVRHAARCRSPVGHESLPVAITHLPRRTKNPPPSVVIARPLPGNAGECQPLNTTAITITRLCVRRSADFFIYISISSLFLHSVY